MVIWYEQICSDDESSVVLYEELPSSNSSTYFTVAAEINPTPVLGRRTNMLTLLQSSNKQYVLPGEIGVSPFSDASIDRDNSFFLHCYLPYPEWYDPDSKLMM